MCNTLFPVEDVYFVPYKQNFIQFVHHGNNSDQLCVHDTEWSSGMEQNCGVSTNTHTHNPHTQSVHDQIHNDQHDQPLEEKQHNPNPTQHNKKQKLMEQKQNNRNKIENVQRFDRMLPQFQMIKSLNSFFWFVDKDA